MGRANDHIKRRITALSAQVARLAKIGWRSFSGAARLVSFLIWLLSKMLYEPVRILLAMGQAILRMIFAAVRWAGILIHALVRGAHRRASITARNAGIGFIHCISARDGAAFFCALLATGLIAGLWAIPPTAPAPTNPAPEQRSVSDPVLARINQTPVRLSDVEAYARHTGQLESNQGLRPSIAWRRGLVAKTIEQFLIVSAARKTDLINHPDLRARIRAAQHRIIVAAFLDNEVNAAVTSKAIWDVYESQLEALSRHDEFRLSVIEMASPETAKAVKKALDLGLPFADMAKKYSQDPSSAQYGGDLGYIRLTNFPEPVLQHILSLSKGETSRPLEYGKSWYLYQMTDRRKTVPPSFAGVKDNIRSYLSDEVIIALLDELQEENKITLYK